MPQQRRAPLAPDNFADAVGREHREQRVGSMDHVGHWRLAVGVVELVDGVVDDEPVSGAEGPAVVPNREQGHHDA